MIVYKTESVGLEDPVFRRMLECLGGITKTGCQGREVYEVPTFASLQNLRASDAKEFDHFQGIWGPPKAQAYLGNQEMAHLGGWGTVRAYLIDHSQLIGGGFVTVEMYSGPNKG